MSVDRNELRAGVLLLVALAVLAAGLLVLAGSGSLFRSSRHVAAVFANVRGVREGDPVRFAGLKVGEVDALVVRTDLEPPRIEASLRVPEGLAIPRDSEVRVVETLTGARIVEIFPGKGAPLAAGEVLADDRIPVGIDGIAERVSDLAGQVVPVVEEATSLLRRMDGLVKEIGDAVEAGKVRGILASLETASGDLAETSRSLRATVEAARPKVEDALGSLQETGREAAALLRDARPEVREILARVKAAAEGAAALLEGPEAPVARTIATVDGAAKSLDAAIGELSGTGREARDLIASSRTSVEAILERLKTTGTNLKAASEDLRAHPWKLLNEPDAEDQRVQEIFNAARNFNSGAEALADAVRDLRAALDRGGADDPEARRLLDAIGRSFADYDRAEKLFWEALRAK